jgi:hypothetical protein
MTLVRVVPALILLAVISGCSSVSVTEDFDPEVDFSVYRTWDWLPGEPPETGDRRLDAPQVRERIGRIVEEEFAAHGYPLSPDQPDLYVIYHVALDQEINMRTVLNYYQYMDYVVVVPGLASSYTDVWDIGTLIIDVFDAKEHTLIWRGLSRSKFNAQAGPRENEPVIRTAVRKMLDQFPPD